MQLEEQSGLSPRAGQLLLSEETLSGAWRKGKSREVESGCHWSGRPGCGVQGVSATTVVLVALATREKYTTPSAGAPGWRGPVSSKQPWRAQRL